MKIASSKIKIINSLINIASKKGLDNISISILANSLNLSKSSIFSHFKNKEDLIDQMYKFGQIQILEKSLHFSFEGSSEEVLTRAVDYWHEIYSQHSNFHIIVEMQKFIDLRAKEISISLETMISSQTQVVLEILNETSRLNIDELDLAIESFSTTITKYLKSELLNDRENTQWKEDRFIQRFCNHYK